MTARMSPLGLSKPYQKMAPRVFDYPITERRPCRWCETSMEGRQKDAKYCSAACREAASRARHLARYGPSKRCSLRGCQRKHYAKGFCRKHYPSSDRARARHWGADYQEFSRTDIYDRDGWCCGLCFTRVDPTLKAPDMMRVSLDHIIPFSRGGDHTPDNVQCSHLLCNIRKNNSMLDGQVVYVDTQPDLRRHIRERRR